MSTGVQHQERVPMNLKKQLALAVRNIQWSYAIFWSISTREPGVLEWGDGYYNGDIKTRKTVQAVELNTDQLSLQRSEQLRQLYESLSAGESSPQAKRPSAALSPEDLTDTEWYYLVCMSFVFNIGQGLPGRTLSSGQPVWLCNAHCADSKVFGRSLLAKFKLSSYGLRNDNLVFVFMAQNSGNRLSQSASIQTVVCFPFSGGVVELGVTDLVLEDLSLIQRVKTLFLDDPQPIVSNRSIQVDGMNNDLACPALDPLILATKLSPILGCEQLETVSPDDSPEGLEPKQSREDSLLIEGINGGASQVQSWQFMDKEFSNCVHHSLNSSDCISQTIADHRKVVPLCRGENDNGLQDVEECNKTKLTSFDRQNDDRHFHEVLSALLKSSHPLILGPQFRNSNKESSFIRWQKNGLVKPQKERDETPQKLLKKILFLVPHMHDRGLIESPETNAVRDAAWRPEADEICGNHVLSERKRREKINERLMILKSLVPANNKADKVSILDVTIEYLQALERRVAELESCRKLEARMKVERTSDNYGNNKTDNGKKSSLSKRKAYDVVDEADQEIGYVASKDGSTDNVTVSMNNKELLIEFKCPWREGILLEVMDALSILNLDCHSVQSSTTGGILSLTIKSKYKGSSVAKAGPIEQALQRIASKC
ncbi:basic helix-loop-helix protein 062A [Gossypium australe]|uniref:Basic helix-loop-helix protein 062A n=1 Tax=Gossypium australe TaxID=47621 RepID=A0A5B6VIS6_9ROSI|nr:basic helix-loop-helix protein 062A [Gossypium australe]